MAILTINSGSSSLKLALYSPDGQLCRLTASAEGIGRSDGQFSLQDSHGSSLLQQDRSFSNQHEAFDALLREMQQRLPESIDAAGHRIVHGGPHLAQHCRIDEQTLSQLRAAVHFAHLHIPPAIDLVEHTQTALPHATQFACFDTTFHQTMPPEAYTYALPRPYRDAGVRRFGFHGLSYESVVRKLGTTLPQRTVVAHLGSGASACAILKGQSIDTSMGLSPAGGFSMATRPGDLDPGVVLLMQRGLNDKLHALTADALEAVLNHQSGLQGLAGESDTRKLLQRADSGETDAQLALTIFAREVAKTIAGYFVLLGGIDLLVFTGGIGEHSSPIRSSICGYLQCLGLQLHMERNHSDAPEVISDDTSQVAVRVVRADENGQIASHVAALRNT